MKGRSLNIPHEPPELEGKRVRLVPLEQTHIDSLCMIGLEKELWEFTVSRIRSRGEMQAYVSEALGRQQDGTALPFVIIDRETSSIVGSTRYGNIDRLNRRMEIGWTWIGKQWQRTTVNTEAKYLLLQFAFESVLCVRVEFKTDALNLRSRAALARIGAVEEGTLRKHMVTGSGRFRDTVYFSILDDEWPEVKKALEAKLLLSR
ncbi:MAG: GNAT family N-acetyltransferase [Ignavibacteria bacterium]|nr:GNAT family N-acetyltransferase [Ignavibacteria bacterium]